MRAEGEGDQQVVTAGFRIRNIKQAKKWLGGLEPRGAGNGGFHLPRESRGYNSESPFFMGIKQLMGADHLFLGIVGTWFPVVY